MSNFHLCIASCEAICEGSKSKWILYGPVNTYVLHLQELTQKNGKSEYLKDGSLKI